MATHLLPRQSRLKVVPVIHPLKQSAIRRSVPFALISVPLCLLVGTVIALV